MTFDKWFNKQSRLMQLILLVIPGVNWVVELLVRLSVALRKQDLISILLFIICIPGVGVILGWIDLICILLCNHLFMTK